MGARWGADAEKCECVSVCVCVRVCVCVLGVQGRGGAGVGGGEGRTPLVLLHRSLPTQQRQVGARGEVIVLRGATLAKTYPGLSYDDHSSPHPSAPAMPRRTLIWTPRFLKEWVSNMGIGPAPNPADVQQRTVFRGRGQRLGTQ